MTCLELRFGSSLIHNAQVICALIRVGKLLKAGMGFIEVVRGAAGELVSNRQAQLAQRHLVFRIGGQDVTANRFGFFRLVQITIMLHLGQRFSNAAFRDGLKLALHISVAYAPNRRQVWLPRKASAPSAARSARKPASRVEPLFIPAI